MQGKQPQLSRRGTAPLEFILVLVPISILFITLMWMGKVGINQTSVTVDVRYQAWEKRDQQKANPFEFTDFYQGMIQANGTRPVRLSPLVDNLITPKSEHTLFAGAWQHPHIDINRSPNWNLYPKLGVGLAKGKWNEMGRIAGGLGELPQKMAEGITDQVTNGIESKLDQMFSGLLGSQRQANNELNTKKQNAKKEGRDNLRKQRADVQKQMAQAEADLKAAKLQIQSNEDEIVLLKKQIEEEEKKSDSDEEKIKDMEDRIEDLEKENKDLKEKEVPRLEAAIQELQTADEELHKSQQTLESNE